MPHQMGLPVPAQTSESTSDVEEAEIPGEDETLLWEIAADMEPEDGCLWIYDTDDRQTVAFTPAGMECLQEMLKEHKRNRSPPRS